MSKPRSITCRAWRPFPLPPASVEFVEERREALDRYLQALLGHEQLRREWPASPRAAAAPDACAASSPCRASPTCAFLGPPVCSPSALRPRSTDCSDLYEFLRAGSQLYELASPQQQPPRRAPGCAARASRAAGGRGSICTWEAAAGPAFCWLPAHPDSNLPGPAYCSAGALQQAQQAQQQQQQQQRNKVLGGLSRAVLETSHSVGRGLSSATGATRAAAGTFTQGVTGLAAAAGEGVAGLAAAAGEGMAKAANGVAEAAGAVVGALAGRDERDAAEAEEQRAGAAPGPWPVAAAVLSSGHMPRRSRCQPSRVLLRACPASLPPCYPALTPVPALAGLARRVRSVPVALDRADSDGSGELLAAQRPNSGSALARDRGSGGLLSKASLRLRQVVQREGSASAPAQQLLEPSGHSSSSSAGSEAVSAPPSARVSQQQPGPASMPLQLSGSGSLSSELAAAC